MIKRKIHGCFLSIMQKRETGRGSIETQEEENQPKWFLKDSYCWKSATLFSESWLKWGPGVRPGCSKRTRMSVLRLNPTRTDFGGTRARPPEVFRYLFSEGGVRACAGPSFIRFAFSAWSPWRPRLRGPVPAGLIEAC